jgi:hypothetical protein
MQVITYQDVFGVPLGDEVQESHGATYKPCPAAEALRKQLRASPFFAGAKLGGTGPLYRPWKGNTHEFNRHHAGLAVDIMLTMTNDAEVALGHHLVLLFKRMADVIKWRGIVYQNIAVNGLGQLASGMRVNCWTGGGHEDHVHIDWHDTANTKWKDGITEVPLKKIDGNVIKMKPADGTRIAESITWTSQAMTAFDSDATLEKELADLMAKHGRGELKKLNMMTELGLSKC